MILEILGEEIGLGLTLEASFSELKNYICEDLSIFQNERPIRTPANLCTNRTGFGVTTGIFTYFRQLKVFEALQLQSRFRMINKGL